ncbi:twin-arginine translocase subunit TatC [Parasalinivibrio latis]|uniref:twin-arginine translocase subunit TatC n=1 Tax=Parasalinivibrio latis TaxID=2952610 RepID=UPI0030E426CD
MSRDLSKSPELEASRAPLLNHLLEIRRRLMLCFLFFIVVFIVAYAYSGEVYQYLTAPLVDVFGEDSGRRMIYTGLHEAFFTYMKLAFFTAMFASLPLLLIQVWCFIAPGLYRSERKAYSPVFLVTPVLFVAGAGLAFYVVMPLAWEFFISFEMPQQSGEALKVELEARVSEYLNLVIKMLLAFGLSFELPVLFYVMAKVGALSVEDLIQYRKHAIVIIFLIAAFVTPPDIISQFSLGVPLVVLYETSILILRRTNRELKESPVAE